MPLAPENGYFGNMFNELEMLIRVQSTNIYIFHLTCEFLIIFLFSKVPWFQRIIKGRSAGMNWLMNTVEHTMYASVYI